MHSYKLASYLFVYYIFGALEEFEYHVINNKLVFGIWLPVNVNVYMKNDIYMKYKISPP